MYLNKINKEEIHLSVDDVLIQPQFTRIESRSHVNVTQIISEDVIADLPIISSNMQTITEEKMCHALNSLGAVSFLHRFCSVDENVALYNLATIGSNKPELIGVSIGVGHKEKERAIALYDAGCRLMCIDVAHGAQQRVVDMTRWIRKTLGSDTILVVGNFATTSSIEAFNMLVSPYKLPDYYKVGIGGGSVCQTRIKTGAGRPHFETVLDCAQNYPVIADGGSRTPGDVAKYLAAGARLVMIGSMFAGTKEAAGTTVEISPDSGKKIYKTNYKGSAATNYAQGWRTSEGGEVTPTYKGSVIHIVKDIEGGIRSSMTYSNASNLDEFRAYAKFIRVSPSTIARNDIHYNG